MLHTDSHLLTSEPAKKKKKKRKKKEKTITEKVRLC